MCNIKAKTRKLNTLLERKIRWLGDILREENLENKLFKFGLNEREKEESRVSLCYMVSKN